jgi:hypothetical protein
MLYSFHYSLLIPYRSLSFILLCPISCFVLYSSLSFIPICCLFRFVHYLTFSFIQPCPLVLDPTPLSRYVLFMLSLYPESSFILLSFIPLYPLSCFGPLTRLTFILLCPLSRFNLYPALSFSPFILYPALSFIPHIL